MSDDLDDYLATLSDEDRCEIERLAALPIGEYMAEVAAHDATREAGMSSELDEARNCVRDLASLGYKYRDGAYVVYLPARLKYKSLGGLILQARRLMAEWDGDEAEQANRYWPIKSGEAGGDE